jgi:hypothetical protein
MPSMGADEDSAVAVDDMADGGGGIDGVLKLATFKPPIPAVTTTAIAIRPTITTALVFLFLLPLASSLFSRLSFMFSRCAEK